MTEAAPKYGQAQAVAPQLTRLVAPNPSPMTHWGTNTFVLGGRDVVVIDPGPESDAHLSALIAAIGGRRVSHILVTHSHLDHSPLARRLRQVTDAPVCAFGPSDAGRTDQMNALAHAGLMGGGEGVHLCFTPDICLYDGEILVTGVGPITVLHTPGHFGNHMCFQWGEVLFSGDHVLAWASTFISPPDGDLGQFLWSCERLMSNTARCFFPAHGPAITEPKARLAWLVAHRQDRSAAILTELDQRAASAEELTANIYAQIPKAMWPAAKRNVLAHLVHLSQIGAVQPQGSMHADAVFTRCPHNEPGW